MADNLNDRGPQNRARINLNEEHEFRYWIDKFGVSADELQRAVAEEGVMADAVERNLKG